MELDDFFQRAQPAVEERARLIRASEQYGEYLDAWEAPFPHCDSRVLHSPGVCVYCDQVKPLQEYRKMCGLPFSDELQANDALLPGETRNVASAHAWGGNQPRKG